MVASGERAQPGWRGTMWNARKPLSWSVSSYLLTGPLQMAERHPDCTDVQTFSLVSLWRGGFSCCFNTHYMICYF